MRNNLIPVVISMILVTFLLMACGGSSEPPHPGVFIKAGKQLIETAKFQGEPSSTVDLPKTIDSQPTLVVWLENLVVDYLVIRDNFGNGNVIAFTTKSVSNGITELQVQSPLKDDAYCLVKGDPLASPFDVPYYCFRVGNPATTEIVTPVSVGQQAPSPVTAAPTIISVPTPDLHASQTAVSVAATQLVNPGNVATQAAAAQVIEEATAVAVETTATVVAADVARLQMKATRWASVRQAGEDCTNRVRSKIESGDYSEIRRGADLTGCDLRELNLFGLDFGGVNLSYANLQGANLKGAIFDADSNLERADLRSANLDDVDLSKAITRLAVFSMPLPPTVHSESVVRHVANGSWLDVGSLLPYVVWIPARGQIFWSSYLYDSESGTQMQEFRWADSSYPPIFSPDGKLVAPEWGFVTVVDDGRRLGGSESFITFLGWSPDGTAALIRTGDLIELWNLTTGETLVSISGASSGTLSPDGKQIAVSQEEGITLWNVQTGTEDKTLLPRVQAANLAYSSDGQWLVVWEEGDRKEVPSQLRVVNVDNGEIVFEQIRPNNVIDTVAWIPTRHLLVVTETTSEVMIEGEDSTDDADCFSKLSMWNIASSPEIVQERTFECHALAAPVADPRGDWIAFNMSLNPGSANSQVLMILDTDDGSELGAEFYRDAIFGIAPSPDGKSLAISFGDYDPDVSLSLRLFPIQALLSP